MSMMSGLFMIAGRIMRGCFLVMLRSERVMLGCLRVMTVGWMFVGRFFSHGASPLLFVLNSTAIDQFPAQRELA